jgi:hydrogenase maturation protein HypF
MKRLRLEVKGTVQGVGFRPTVYRYAKERSLGGWVSNTSAGVVIEVEGPAERVDDFVTALRRSPPPRADITSMDLSELPLGHDKEFRIKASAPEDEPRTEVSPDLATCADCLRELADPRDKRRSYPFINCTNCGPRFTIVEGIPYDRGRTVMRRFRMCPECQREYSDPMDRRFHAQPNACPACGPKVWLAGKDGSPLAREDVLEKAVSLLAEGRILAVKGLGGFHLACDAQQEAAVWALRSRKFREDKPFAVMVPDLGTARVFCETLPEEEELLSSVRRPIVLLRRRPACPIAGSVAPRQKNLGLMLPYTPLHALLFAPDGPRALVMTSGNLSDEPIAHENEDALRRLASVADAFLLHDRDIHIRCDDTVTRFFDGEERVLRRSRGYVPASLSLPVASRRPLLACGAQLKNAFCLARDGRAFLSHHIGDLDDMQTLSSLETGVRHFQSILRLQPSVLACDLHPDYLSTRYAQDLAASRPGTRLVRVQHHHAHIASCLAENGTAERVIGVAFDGTGYGEDGAVWGGEFLLADFRGFVRFRHLPYVRMPGGEAAIREPWRMAASWLHSVYGDAFLDLPIPFARKLDRTRWEPLRRMLAAGVNSPPTSSMGRLFDAVSALLGIRETVHYEGQAAIELEMSSADAGEEPPPYPGGLDIPTMLRALVDDLAAGKDPGLIARRFHVAVAQLAAEVCLAAREETGLDTVALSGGVFQNMRLLGLVSRRLKKEGFRVLTHSRVPPNDGGICLGQAAVAGAEG